MFYKVGIATVGLALAISPAAAVTLVTTSGWAEAGADVRDNPAVVGDYFGDSWSGTPSSLLADISVTATGRNRGTVTASSHSAADWDASGRTGTISLSNSWLFDTAVGEGNVSAAFRAPSWTYEFTPNSNAMFTLTFDIVGSGDMFGLQGYILDIDGNGTNLSGANYTSDPTNSGTVSALLTGGTSHLITLYTNGNLSALGQFSASSDETGRFSFNITDAVPEPASWAMMLGGFALIGGVMRSRRASRIVFA